jgi:hypothetical protein
MAYIDIDLSEFATCELVDELEDRGYKVLSKEEKDYATKSKFASSYSIDRLFDAAQLRQHLADITDSASFASTEEILERLKNLLNK